jgi:hypothetical protein
MSLDLHSAPSITPAFSHLRIRRIMCGSPIRCSTKRMTVWAGEAHKDVGNVRNNHPELLNSA